jgi:DNA-binding transcriptional regulator YhcF (GntR family)
MQADTASQALDFAIDRNAEVPIGVQLAWALRARIRDGRLVPGQRLPGLRELAESLKVNANTVRAVYQRLEHEGIIESQRGNGTFVAAVPQAQRSAVAAIAANAAREALRTGVDPREVAAALYVEPVAVARSEPEQAERRQRLRTQIAVLEQALVEIEVAHPGLLATTRPTQSSRGPRLLEADELEQVQSELAIDQSAQPAPADEQPQLDPVVRPAPKRVAARARAKTRPAPAGA